MTKLLGKKKGVLDMMVDTNWTQKYVLRWWCLNYPEQSQTHGVISHLWHSHILSETRRETGVLLI